MQNYAPHQLPPKGEGREQDHELHALGPKGRLRNNVEQEFHEINTKIVGCSI